MCVAGSPHAVSLPQRTHARANWKPSSYQQKMPSVNEVSRDVGASTVTFAGDQPIGHTLYRTRRRRAGGCDVPAYVCARCCGTPRRLAWSRRVGVLFQWNSIPPLHCALCTDLKYVC
jgi:hypothetical protein